MASQSASLMGRFVAALTHPEQGWKTTHFWGPVANWGLVGAAVYDAAYKGPEIIDIEMTGTMIGYSGLFMGFAWQVQPRNYLLFACHTFNVTAQANQLRRAIEYKVRSLPNPGEELTKIGTKMAGTAGTLMKQFTFLCSCTHTVRASYKLIHSFHKTRTCLHIAYSP